MQRLTRLTMLSPRAAQPALAMVKETGTPVDFTDSREIDLQSYMFRDDVFGLYAYQGVPAMVAPATRDAFVNGNLADLLTQAAGQGMEIQYIIISWNETPTPQGFWITDLVVGVVAKVTRDFNTGPAYLIDALNAVGWFNQMVSKRVMPWQSWLLLTATQTEAYHSWYWEAVSGTWTKSAPLGQPIPDPPSIDEVKNVVTPEANAALGEFMAKLIDEGFTPTILGLRVQVCYERSREFISAPWGTHYYRYRTHLRFSWDFITDPPFTTEDTRLLPGFITGAFILKLILLIGGLIIIGVVAFTFTNNMTTERTGYVQYGPVPVPGTGEWVTDPETGEPVWTGEWEWGVVEEGWTEGPPDFWADVIPTIVLGALIIIGAVIVVPPIIRSFRGM